MKHFLQLFSIVIAGWLLMPSALGAQSRQRVTMELRAATVEQAVLHIERTTDYGVAWREGILPAERRDFSLSDATIEQAMNYLVQGTDLRWSAQGNIVTITKTSQQQPRQNAATGRVIDEQGRPLTGASVMIKGTQTGTATDAAGHFSIPLRTPTAMLTVSCMGKENVDVLYSGRTLVVTLQDAVVETERVVVTGIFNKPRESYTGAARQITARELAAAGNRSLLSSIQNVDPSFNMVDDITLGSDPNALPNITVRGTSSLDAGFRDVQEGTRNRANMPLFVLDGFEISLERVQDLDRNQVESVTLLKDAAATAMWGTRGANGVVVITSTKPKEGSLRVTYKGSMEIEAPMLASYNLMNATEKLDYELAAGLYTVEGLGNTEQQLILNELYNARLMDVQRGVNTQWLRYPVRTGIGQRHSLRIDGGREELTYALNLGYNNVNGAMRGSRRNTFNGDMMLGYNYKNLQFRNVLELSVNRSANSPYGRFADYTAANAYFKPYDEDGNLIKTLESQYYMSMVSGIGAQPQATRRFFNPLWNALQPSLDESRYHQIRDNAEVVWSIVPGELTMRGQFGYTLYRQRGDRYKSPEHTDFDGLADLGRRGSYVLSENEMRKIETSISLNYNKRLGDIHQIYAGLYGSYADSKSEMFRIAAEGISNPHQKWLGAATLYEQGGRPFAEEGLVRRLGGTANVNYTLAGRYFVDVTGTVEGSSIFGANRRTAPFWSVGAGWNLHETEWLKGAAAVNVARLRLSYGTSGSQNFNPYQSLLTFKSYGDTNYAGWSGVYLLGLGNPDLGWQKTHTLNAGFDIELLDRRLTLTADIYNKTTRGVLADVALPSAAGFESYRANIGRLENRGVELGVGVVIVRDPERRIRWSVGGTMVHNRNEIKKISNSLELLNDRMMENDGVNPSFLFKEGQSINTIFAVKSMGINPATGAELFIDRNGDITDRWDPRDKVACGVAEPRVWGTVNTSLAWRTLTLTAIFSYRTGGDYYNQTLADRVENVYPYNNLDRRAGSHRWRQPGDVARFKSVRDFSTTNATSRFVMRESMVQCKSLSLTWEPTPTWLNGRYVCLGVSTDDLFRLSTIRQERGLNYPFSKKVSVSLTLRF